MLRLQPAHRQAGQLRQCIPCLQCPVHWS